MSREDYIEEKPTKKKKKLTKAQKRKRRKWIIIGEVIVLLILAVVLFIFSKFGLIGRLDFNEKNVEVNDGLMSNGKYTTWALFGVDSRNVGSVGKGTHSDCIIIASINNETKEVKMASVYRDTYLDVAKKGEDYYFKSNQAYFLGGPEQAVSMLNKNLDLNITDYVTVDFKALSSAIDLLGGIDAEVTYEEAEYANAYAEDTASHTGIKFTPIPEKNGVVHMDGTVATGYARVRYTAGDDFKRTERQRIVIEKALEKAKKADLLTLNKLIDTVLPMCATSFSTPEMLGLAKDLGAYKIGETIGFPIDKTGKTLDGPGSVVIPEGLSQNVAQLHAFLYDEEDYQVSETVKKINDKIIKATGVKAKVQESSSASSSSASGSKTTTTKKTNN